MQDVNPVNDLQVHRIRLAKTDARIQDDPVPGDPRLTSQSHTFPHVRKELRQELAVIRLLPVVHQAARRAVLRDQPPHPGIVFQPPDIIDEIRPCIEGRPRYRALISIHGDRRIEPGFQRFNDRRHPADLFFIADPGMPRARGLAAHIQDVRPLPDHLLRSCKRRIQAVITAPVRE